MAKTNQIKKLINGEIADADDVNQIVENAGSEGGLIPYDETSHQRETLGDEDAGSTTYPWGNLYVNKEKSFIEIDTVSPSVSASVLFKNLRRFIFLKDAPNSYTGQAGKFPKVNDDEDALVFSTPTNVNIFTTSGSFTVPASISKICISMVGGGGGAGGSNSTSTGGGGGAEGIKDYWIDVTPGATYSVTVGLGGAGGDGSTGSDGTDGGDTSFDSLLTVSGGAKGLGSANSGTAGLGATATSMNASGSVGGSYQTQPGGNGAGGSGNIGGGGGGSIFGKGGDSNNINDGDPGEGFGSGGGGAGNDGGTNTDGGNGADGILVIVF